jgi:hypothetical protein
VTDDLNNFLEHYGVKGMQWGVRKSDSTSSGARRGPTKAQMKYVAKELGFGSIGPAALLMGAGPPISIALGVSVGVLRSPPVANAIKQSSKATADLMKEIGQTKLSVMREGREAQDRLKAAAKTVDKDLIKQLA